MNPNGRKEAAALLVLLLTVLFPIPSSGGPMTLSDAIETALDNNPGLRLASVNRQSSEVEVSRLEAAFNPTVSVDLGAAGHLVNGGEEENYRTASAGVTARYNLYNGGADKASLDGARRDSLAASLDYDQERQALLHDVTTSYLKVLSSSDILSVRQEDLTAARTQLERVEAFYRAGSRPVTDLYQQQASVKEAELALISAQRDLEVNRLQLLTILGLDEDPRSGVSDPTLQSGACIEVSTNLGTMINTALANRRDLKAQKERVQAAERRVAEARGGSSAIVDLYGSISTSYSTLDSEGLWDQMGDDNLASSAGISLSLPLYDARQTDHAVRQAELNLIYEQISLNRLRQQVREQLSQALEEYLMAVKSLEVSAARLQWAEKALESVNARYEAGAANLVELNDARSVAVQARYDLVNARYDGLMKALACAYYQGDVESAIIEVLSGGKEL